MKKERIKKIIVFSIIFIFALIVIVFVMGEKHKVCFEEKCVDVEIAETLESRQKGLMFRESLPERNGMLFIFEESDNHPFWMKNTLIQLEIIWIDENFKVVHIEHAIPCKNDPCAIYDPNKIAKYVLEVNPRFVANNEIKVGDEVVIKYQNAKI